MATFCLWDVERDREFMAPGPRFASFDEACETAAERNDYYGAGTVAVRVRLDGWRAIEQPMVAVGDAA